MTTLFEMNFDGLVGPTHNFAGLSFGNIASKAHSRQKSHPRKAALQGLEKMARLMRLGLPQGVFPPHERPHIPTLRQLGFQQSPEKLLPFLHENHPQLLFNMSSASPMWVANAGTTSASLDTADGKTHFTAANLSSMLHRSIEHEFTSRIFKQLFADEKRFAHHPALPGTQYFGDEGAANHTRFCSTAGKSGLNMFVYGQSYFQGGAKPERFPARQTLEASQAIARQHGLSTDQTLFVQQNPAVIDQGVFHNDVIAVGSKNILLCHEQAFLNQKNVLKQLRQQQEANTKQPFYILEAKTQDISVQDAVSTYLFNTQIVFLNQDNALIIAPIECQENAAVHEFLQGIIARENPVQDVLFFDLRQSMNNGGGPACLRFRVALTAEEQQSIIQTTNTTLTEALYDQLVKWVSTHYREELAPEDLADPSLYRESTAALDELSKILKLGSDFYDFQRE